MIYELFTIINSLHFFTNSSVESGSKFRVVMGNGRYSLSLVIN